MQMTRAELETATAKVLGGNVADYDLEHLQRLITITQHATDILLNEIEQRDELTFIGDTPIVPYMADHSVETILTRPM